MSTTLAVEHASKPDVELGGGAREGRRLELGIGIVVIAVPLAFLPMSSAPFVNVKLVLLMVGVVAVWLGRPRPNSLRRPALLWIGMATLAALIGVDRWWSLTGPENSGTGLLLLGASAFLLVAGASTPASIRARVPLWMVWSCSAVAAVALADRFLGSTLHDLVGGLSLEGGTLGEPVFLAALMAAGVAAAVGVERLPPPALAVILTLLTSALALTTKRVGWVALAAALAVALLRSRPPRARAILIVGVVALTLATWTALDAYLPSDEPSAARRFSQLSSGSARARMDALVGLGRAWRERPILGWGPGNTWSAHLASATASELRHGERGVGDAHNLLVESAVTTGVLGLAALVLLGAVTIAQIRKGPRAHGWAAGAAAALAVSHLLQPLNLSLTPLLFLLAGIATRSPPSAAEADERHGSTRRPRLPRSLVRGASGLVLAASLILSLQLLAAAILEQHGRTYAAEWALRASVTIAPGRISASEALAEHLAFDGRSGDAEAAREAVSLATGTVRQHPWNPGVRLAVADVYLMLRDPEQARLWIERQRDLFPGDPILPGGDQDPENEPSALAH